LKTAIRRRILLAYQKERQMRTLTTVLLVMLSLTIVGAQEHDHGDHDATVHHGFEDVERWVRIFDSPERNEWQRPSKVVRVLGIYDGDQVADLGAGTGYFTQVLSRAVGSQGKVYAVDIEAEMLAYIDQREDMGAAEVVTIQADPDDPKLPDGELELILVVNTWHHLDGRNKYLKKLRRALDTEGRVAIIDWREGELPMGPPAGSKLSREAVVAEFENAGWSLVTESVLLPYQYFLIFYPPESK
jgi:ubiquinone/menaquinone biosynthesis C-methylase UbiE